MLDLPTGLAWDAMTNSLLIADTYNHRVVQYLTGASSGIVVAGGNGCGMATNQLCYPMGLHFESSTRSLLITNSGEAHNVVRWRLGDSQWTIVAGSTNGTFGSTNELLLSPLSVTQDMMGNVYVADTDNHRIQLFRVGSRVGETIAGETGSSGDQPNRLSRPFAVVLDDRFNLYVADLINNRIQKFVRY